MHLLIFLAEPAAKPAPKPAAAKPVPKPKPKPVPVEPVLSLEEQAIADVSNMKSSIIMYIYFASVSMSNLMLSLYI